MSEPNAPDDSVTKTTSQPDKRLVIGLGLLAAALFVAGVSQVIPPGVDWRVVFRPAALEAAALRNPYEVTGFYYPIWLMALLVPLALLPANIGNAVLMLLGLASFAYAAHRLGATPLTFAAFLLSPPVLHSLLNSNPDWLSLLGFVLPPQIGLFLVVVKPQTGSTVMLFWLIEAWRKGGFREAIRVFAPVTAAMLISFAVFGLWPLRAKYAMTLWWNASLWPFSIPAGLALLAAALKRRTINYAMGAAPCLSPYVLLHSWSGALAGLIPAQVEFLAAVVGLWLLVGIRAGVFDHLLTQLPF